MCKTLHPGHREVYTVLTGDITFIDDYDFWSSFRPSAFPFRSISIQFRELRIFFLTPTNDDWEPHWLHILKRLFNRGKIKRALKTIAQPIINEKFYLCINIFF